jgi:putative FmdB family regulatory protein
MPIYEYKCKCGEAFEKRQPLADRATATCPNCGISANKIFSLFGVTWTWIIDGITHDNPRRTHDPYVE